MNIMTQPNSAFASVKLPTALVAQAREAAQPMRRSVAGQVEYWATLGRIVEHSGLTAQEAQTAIANYEAAALTKLRCSRKSAAFRTSSTSTLHRNCLAFSPTRSNVIAWPSCFRIQ